MYMCRYMFIWAVCPTTVEMDLTFVMVERFNGSYNLVLVWPLPLLSLYREPISEPRLWISWMCGVGWTGTWTFRDRQGCRFCQLMKDGSMNHLNRVLTRTRASLVTALRHTSTATRPRAPMLVCLHFWCLSGENKQRKLLKLQLQHRHILLFHHKLSIPNNIVYLAVAVWCC